MLGIPPLLNVGATHVCFEMMEFVTKQDMAIAKVRDGISCLREVGNILGKRPLSVFNLGHTHLGELCIRQLSTAIAPMPYTVLS